MNLLLSLGLAVPLSCLALLSLLALLGVMALGGVIHVLGTVRSRRSQWPSGAIGSFADFLKFGISFWQVRNSAPALLLPHRRF
jgi:hypothetical protein